MSTECAYVMRRNKMLIYLETGNVYFENQNSGESIFDFFYAQQDYNFYVSEYLMFVRAENDDRFEMLKYKNSKFLFCHFNNLLNRENHPV